MRAGLGFITFSFLLVSIAFAAKDDRFKAKRMEKPKDDGKWKAKSVLDYTESDLDKLYDQWEVS